jgi:hypothetical protein
MATKKAPKEENEVEETVEETETETAEEEEVETPVDPKPIKEKKSPVDETKIEEKPKTLFYEGEKIEKFEHMVLNHRFYVEITLSGGRKNRITRAEFEKLDK